MEVPFSIDIKLMADDVALAYRRAGYTNVHTVFHQVSTDPATVTPSFSPPLGIAREIDIDSDSLFICLAINISSRDGDHGGGLSPYTGINVSLRQQASRYFITGPVALPFQTQSGTGEAPHILGFPLIFLPQEKLRVLWQFNEDTSNNTILTLDGMKLYADPLPDRVIQPEH